ncbi:DUF2167 domain-containing protein [Pelagibius marinus]|uniref:DUF2167 domain-containing protein n=1 Tax=Pelagibius marinus TaxID=2762760 RepID=UPI0018724B0D|nr:DUF2167 domain-containing protein [Pelagibius marinus]
MKPLQTLTAALMLSCLAVAPAQALTEDEQAQLDAIAQNVVDASAGTQVGNATITAQGAVMLEGQDACAYDRLLNAEETCTIEAILFPPEDSAVDTVYFSPPNEIGYVDMEEWTDDASSQIDEIWESYVEGSKAQSERLGYEVKPVKWVLYPTLNKETKVMTYGFLLTFNGDPVINLHSVKFTRNGYVEMTVVTYDEMLSAANSSFDDVANYAASSYTPDSGFRYADFKDGDKVAAIGAVGVLATVMGVQYSQKGTLAAIGAAILVFAKKLWFLLIAIPVAIWGGIRRLFGRGKTTE